MQTHNNTTLTVEEVESLPIIGTTKSLWRQRNIILREHPEEADRVISDGTTFNGRMRVIGDECRTEWATALDYIAHGKVYVSQ